jgi:hypothetical protein
MRGVVGGERGEARVERERERRRGGLEKMPQVQTSAQLRSQSLNGNVR